MRRIIGDRTVHSLLAGLAIGISSSSASAQDAGAKEVSYTGDRVVRVTPESGERLARVLQLSRHIWSERVGRGPIEVQVPAASYDALLAEGFTVEVLIDDVQALVERERAAIEARAFVGRGDAISFSTYYPYDDLIAFVNQLAGERPDMVTVQSIGQSVQGRDIWTMSITAPGDATGRPDIAYNSLIHAREWITAPTTLYTAERLVRGYGNDPRITNLLDQAIIHITPVLNPDGYVYSWNSERYWRKNRRDNGGGIFGVDLNRNWDITFGGSGASSNPDSDIYHGPNAFSEPETAAMRDFLLGLPDLRAHVDTHSYSQLVLHAPGTFAQSVPDLATLQDVAGSISQEMLGAFGDFYTPQPGTDLYEAAGTFADWTYDEFRQLSFTFELRPTSGGLDGFSPPDFFILPTAEEVSAAYLYLAERAATPLRFIVAPPERLNPGVPRSVAVGVLPGTNQPASTLRVFARDGSTGPFEEISVQPLTTDAYTFTLRSEACGSTLEYYLETMTSTGQTVFYPAAGAAAPIAVPVTADAVVFSDSFNTNLGWTVTNNGLTDGPWERAVPNATGTRGEPFADFERTGWAYVTDNATGNADVDGGQTILTSPVLDATGGTGATLSFAAWLDNTRGSAPQEDALRVEFSSNNGASWVPATAIGPTGPEAAGAWSERSIDIATVVPRTDQFRVRFIAEDLGSGSVVEAAVDAVRLIVHDDCPTTQPCLADVNGDGVASPADFTAWVVAYNSNDPAADQNLDGIIGPDDFTAWVSNYNTGCP